MVLKADGAPQLTNEARNRSVLLRLGSRFTHHGELFLPTKAFYDSLSDAKGLHDAALNIFRWLGRKPTSLHVEYGEKGGLPSSVNQHLIVPAIYRDQPYQTGAWLGLTILQTVLETDNDVSPDRLLTEAGSVEAGLGILILNGLKPRLGIFRRLYTQVHAHHHGAWSGIELTELTHVSYGQLVKQYTDTYRLERAEYWPHLTPFVRYLLPVMSDYNPSQLHTAPLVIVLQSHHMKRWWLKLLLFTAALTFTVILGAYIWGQKPYHPAKNVQYQYDKINLLHQRYASCIQDASRMQGSPVDKDIFEQRQVDNELSRCESLKNQYNYEVEGYNRLVSP